MRFNGHLTRALIALALVTAACGVPAPAGEGVAALESTTSAKGDAKKAPTTPAVDAAEKTKKTEVEPKKMKGFRCPVTIPPQPGLQASEPVDVVYSKSFPAPDPWPREYPGEEMVWYGTDELWTALAVDGDHGGRKSVWWSTNFPGGIEEGQPEVHVTWTRLDTEKPVVIDNGGMATNAYIPDHGWFMIAGIDSDQPGCWEVEATYKGATLSYVYEKTG